MKTRILILVMSFVFAFTNAQKLSRREVQITGTKNAKVLGTDEKGNIFDNSSILNSNESINIIAGENIKIDSSNPNSPIISASSSFPKDFYDQVWFKPTLSSSKYNVTDSRGLAIRVGNMVYFNMVLKVLQNSTKGDVLYIIGLPFNRHFSAVCNNFNIIFKNSNFKNEDYSTIRGRIGDYTSNMNKGTLSIYDIGKNEYPRNIIFPTSGSPGEIIISGCYQTRLYQHEIREDSLY